MKYGDDEQPYIHAAYRRIVYRHQRVYDCWQLVGFGAVGWHYGVDVGGELVWCQMLTAGFEEGEVRPSYRCRMKFFRWAEKTWPGCKPMFGLVQGGEFRPHERKREHVFYEDRTVYVPVEFADGE